MHPSLDDEFDPLFCPRCHERVPRGRQNPDGWCHRCVAEVDLQRRDGAQIRVESTTPRCPACGNAGLELTMKTTTGRTLKGILGFVLMLEFMPWVVWRRVMNGGSAFEDRGEPHWRCKACDRVFPMR